MLTAWHLMRVWSMAVPWLKSIQTTLQDTRRVLNERRSSADVGDFPRTQKNLVEKFYLEE